MNILKHSALRAITEDILNKTDVPVESITFLLNIWTPFLLVTSENNRNLIVNLFNKCHDQYWSHNSAQIMWLVVLPIFIKEKLLVYSQDFHKKGIKCNIIAHSY